MFPFRLKSCVLGLFFVFPLAASAQSIAAQDLDQDGVADQLEQALLEKFRPVFMISDDDCDQLPSEFVSGAKGPVALDRNGTIYGQVFRPLSAAPDSAVLEIHYYHLWSRDCGRISHALDAEYVALLVHSTEIRNPADSWKATHWYAAAHEDTVCDTSTIARASAIGAEERAATVWVSRGKHGSYFSPEQCMKGCGQDRCVNSSAVSPGKLINLGERGAPLNGTEWAAFGGWNLARKMSSAFAPTLVSSIETPRLADFVLARPSLKEIQSVVSAVGASLESAELGPERASMAMSLAETKTREAVSLGTKKVRISIRKAKNRLMQWVEKQGL
jgi:hypothetical protein